MSFASETKKELTQIEESDQCLKAEVSAIIRMNGTLSFSNKQRSKRCLGVQFCTLWQRFINFILKVNFQSKIKEPLPRQWHECRCLYIFYSTASISVNFCGICVS